MKKKNNLKNLFFPVLGSISQRVKWRNQIKKKIKENFNKNELIYLELSKKCFSKDNGALNKKLSHDNNHLINREIIYEFQKKINK